MRAALMQMAVTDGEGISERFQKAESMLREVERSGRKPDLIVFPELWGCGFQNFSCYMESAERLRGDTWQFMSRWAKRLQCYIHGGSFVERCGSTAENFNTSIFFDREGQIKGVYRKIHLFGFESMEQKLLTAGKQAVTAETEFGRAGMATCYDLRFPEQFRKEAEPENVPGIFLVAAAWPKARLGHWKLFNQARAVENQCYVISCNAAGAQCGVTGAGHSMVTDPWGEVLAEGGEEEQIVWCEPDLERIAQCRSQFPALKDRRKIAAGTTAMYSEVEDEESVDNIVLY